MKRIIPFLITVAAFALASCNTIQGVGRDITRTGEVIEGVIG